jgi:osmoprotectant transport system permease protein
MIRFCVLYVLILTSIHVTAKEFTVGSKSFTESYILSELIAKTVADQARIETVAKQGMGSTAIVFNALKTGGIDVYPEYWGTLTQEILSISDKSSMTEVNERLLPLGLKAGVFLGFDNAYALAIDRQISDKFNIKKISDLQNHPDLRVGLSHEFLARKDGWPGLSKAYNLSAFKPIGMEHGLVYQAVAKHKIDVFDAYTTDSRLLDDNLVLIKDDQHFFTSYKAILLYKIDSVNAKPEILKAMNSLESKISNQAMQSLNAKVELDHQSIKSVAQSFYAEILRPGNASNSNLNQRQSDWRHFFEFFIHYDFLRLSLQHSQLVVFSLILAVLVGIPIGVCIYYIPRVGKPLLYGVSLFQTIPSLALLSFLIFMVNSIGFIPAFIALFLYALLPIIEATQSGLRSVDRSVIEASKALGTGFWPQLRHIELPLCKPMLFAGIQVAAVWTTGTATIAAFVGAGGYGERIAQGLSTNNTEMMLEGAIPSAIFALLMRKLISSIEHFQNHEKV